MRTDTKWTLFYSQRQNRWALRSETEEWFTITFHDSVSWLLAKYWHVRNLRVEGPH